MIGDGSSGNTGTLEEAAAAAVSFLQSLTNEQGEGAATSDGAAGTYWDTQLAAGAVGGFDIAAVAYMRERYIPSESTRRD